MGGIRYSTATAAAVDARALAVGVAATLPCECTTDLLLAW